MDWPRARSRARVAPALTVSGQKRDLGNISWAQDVPQPPNLSTLGLIGCSPNPISGHGKLRFAHPAAHVAFRSPAIRLTARQIHGKRTGASRRCVYTVAHLNSVTAKKGPSRGQSVSQRAGCFR